VRVSTAAELAGERARDRRSWPAVAERRAPARRVTALFTGGTISMRIDAREGGAVPSLSAEEILAAAPGIERVASVWPEAWGRFPGPHMTVARQWALRNRIAELVADPDVDGVVVTHGTDTLEETAYLVARSLEPDKPVVFTGAMRSASDLGWDGPQNLLDAVRVAAAPESRPHGVLVVMGGGIFAALEDAKTHTHQLDAFEAPGLGPVRRGRRRPRVLPPGAAERPGGARPRRARRAGRHRRHLGGRRRAPPRRVARGRRTRRGGRGDGAGERAARGGARHRALGGRGTAGGHHLARGARARGADVRLPGRRPQAVRARGAVRRRAPARAGARRPDARLGAGYGADALAALFDG
jgi:hypothetical protein